MQGNWRTPLFPQRLLQHPFCVMLRASQASLCVSTRSHKPFTFDDSLRCIELQQIDCDTPHSCFRHDEQPPQLKVIPPGLLTRMKQRNEFLIGRIERGKIAAFELIAGDAGHGEIFRDRFPAMFLRDDVIDLMCMKAQLCWGEAIFTATTRSGMHQTA